MAMVLDAFVSFFVDRLSELIEKEVRMQMGVEDDLRTLKRRLEGLQAYLRDAEKKKIGDESVRLWLGGLREVMYDADDLFDDYQLEADKRQQQEAAPGSSATRRPFLPSCFSCFRFRHEIGKRIADINGKLEEIFKDKPEPLLAEASTRYDDAQPLVRRRDRETSSQFDEDDVVGIDLEAKKLVESLTRGSSEKYQIFALVGMGGIGKTTLAQKVFHDGRIQSHFQVKLWVCVSQDVNVTQLLKAIIESYTGKACRGTETKELLVTKVQQIVEKKKFLLVLDDVWDGRVWEWDLRCPLQSGAINSRVLITTRSKDVARRMGTLEPHAMKLLPDDEGWQMLCKPFKGDMLRRVQSLRPVGMEIVKKCKGLPLAIKAIRGVLIGRDPNERTWSRVLESQHWDLPDKDLPKEIMPALYLSYEDLRPHLQQCFTYCSLFPEDFKFHKLNLVHMWIAEGFVKPDGDRPIEDVADDHYKELVDRNLLQTVPDYFEDWGCKMHDVVRQLAVHVSKHNYIYRGIRHSCDAATRVAGIRHLTIVGRDDSTVPEIYKRNGCLRTVLLSKNPSIKSVPDDFFDKLRRLRVLDLTYTGIETLTDSVGNLIFLRLLNVSFTKLKELPETIQYLRSLQTLKATGCKFLHRLPNGVASLLNLTHLTVADTPLDQMPTGIGKLQKLHSLYGFVANDENQGENNVKELKDLSHLRRLTMHKLEAVSGMVEAESAVLRNKTSLEYLRLSCTRKTKHDQWEDPEIRSIEEVFEGFLPPPSLESLHIDGFFGRHLPSWITRPSLGHLRWLRLEDCELCKELPALGQFSQLRVLHVWTVASVTTVGREFFSGDTQGAPAFPLLEELYFRGMYKWTEWSGLEHGSLPVLKKLHIVKCPKLKSLPMGLHHATSLRQLVIEGTQKLKAIKNLPSISELKISNNRKLGVISNLPELKVMDISNCPSIRETDNLEALGHLRLSGENMDSLPMWLAQITSLHRLDLTGSINLLRRCCTNGEDWHMISLLPRVEASSNDGSKYVSYVKSSSSCESNLAENGI